MEKVKFVSKKKLYPAFGEVKNNIAYVRNDLPKIVKEFVKEHELYHLKDKSQNWVWREVKANLYAFFKHPLGFIICTIMSLSPARLKFYFERFKTGE